MSSTVAIDPGQLKQAAKKVDAMFTDANDTAHALHGLAGGVEMPPNMVARVEDVLTDASTAIARAALGISCLASELNRRAEGAEAADRIGKLAGGLLNLAGISQSGAALGINHPVTPLPKGAVPWVKGAGHGLVVVGVVASVAPQLVGDLQNDYLTKDQVVTRTAKKGGISLAMGAPSMAAAAGVIALGGPAGVALVAGLAVGVGVSVLDEKLHISDWVGDRVDDVADELKDEVDDLADNASSAVNGLKAGIDKKVSKLWHSVL